MSIYLGTTKISGAYTIAKNIGEVFYSQSSSAADNPGGLPLFTGEMISNADQLYPQFYNWVLSHSELCTTNSAYETSIANWGKCSYYVIDDTNKTIKLPKISTENSYIIYSYVNGTNWYRIYSDGWCEQGGQVSNSSPDWVGNEISITFHKPFVDTNYFITATAKETYYTYPVLAVTDYSLNGCKFAAAEGDRAKTPTFCWEAKGHVDISDYQKSPLYPWVFAYNTAISASVAQAAQFQAALSNKADVDFSNTNLSSLLNVISSGLAPNMTNPTVIEQQVTFTADSCGWISFVPTDNTNINSSVNIEFNGYMQLDGKTVWQSCYKSGDDATHIDGMWFYIGIGQTCYHNFSVGTVYFYPIKGISEVSE